MSDEQQSKPAERRERGTVKRKFVSEKQGKEVVSYIGLLDMAHQEGMSYSHVDLIQIPHPDNGQTAICIATVKTDMGSFTDIGDANPTNVSKMILPHMIRMASTRALARALRQATNVGMLCDDELEEDTKPRPPQRPPQNQPPPQAARPAQQPPQQTAPPPATNGASPTDDKPTPAMLAGALKLVIDIARAGGQEVTREQAQATLHDRFVGIYGKPLHEGTRMEVQNLHNTLTQERRTQTRQN